MSNTDRVVCRNIRSCREQRCHTQEQLAYEAELSVSHLSKIERGVTSPTVRTLARIAGALKVPIEAFFCDPSAAART